MEVLIDCYFDRLFSEMERSCLASRYKRRELVNYFTDVINSCAEGNKIYNMDVRSVLCTYLRVSRVSDKWTAVENR